MHPDFYRGPAMVKPPIVYIAGLLRARRHGRAQRLGVDRRPRRPAPVPPAERRRAGTRPAGSTPRPSAAAGSPPTRSPRYDVIDAEDAYDAGERPKAAVAEALRFWGEPADQRRRPARALERYAGAVERRGDRGVAAGARTALLRQNALRMLIATSPDMQTC